MESKELALLKKIRIQTGRKLNTLFMGEYHSAFKGYGLELNSVREYQYGDDVRNIEWNVSARLNHLFIKEFVEERELSVVIMVDMSGSIEFGSRRSKMEVMLEVVTLFLYLAQMNNDRISVLLFTDRVEKFIRPRKGRKFILKVLDEILKFRPSGRGTRISEGVDFLRRVLKKRSVIFVISDFMDSMDDHILKLRLISRKHDLIPVQISDPAEKEMKLTGLVEFLDLETGNVFLSDTVPGRSAYPVLAGFDSIHISTGEPIEKPLLKFFEKRNRAGRIAR